MVGHFILTDPGKTSTKASIAHTVQGPYMAIAAALLVLGIVVMFMHLPAITATRDFRPGDAASGRSIWSYSHTVLGMVGIFFYVGVEISLAAIAITYFRVEGLSDIDTASSLASLYFIFIMAGRFLGSFLMKWIEAPTLLAVLGIFGVVLLLISMFSHGEVAIWTLVLCGLANSIMYPNIFALGVAELGPMTSKGSGVITMGNVGGAIVPCCSARWPIKSAFSTPSFCPSSAISTLPTTASRALSLRALLPHSRESSVLHGPPAFVGGPCCLGPKRQQNIRPHPFASADGGTSSVAWGVGESRSELPGQAGGSEKAD